MRVADSYNVAATHSCRFGSKALYAGAGESGPGVLCTGRWASATRRTAAARSIGVPQVTA